MKSRFSYQLSAIAAKKIIVAVSGGVDSVVLLDLLSAAHVPIAVAHANFQLRGDESDRDEAAVRQIAEKYNAPFFLKRFNTNNYAIEEGISIQMAARDLRYSWFFELLQEEKYDLLATAHHLNDNLETTLINLVRGTGLSGLSGMQALGDKIVRPLLSFSRNEIEQYASQNNLTWREDSSNRSDEYDRNFIRHQIIPRLKEINPSLEVTHSRTVHRLNAARELRDLGMETLMDKYVSVQSESTVIRKALLSVVLNPVGILWEMIKHQGFTFSQCLDMVSVLDGQAGKVFLTTDFQATLDREDIIVAPRHELWNPVEIKLNQEVAELGPWTIRLKEGTSFSLSAGLDMAVMDKAKLVFPLTWRQWQNGDFFYPLGMNHRKKVSDFLIDEKIPASEKHRVTVLESGGNIIWICGYRIDDRVKITPDSTVQLALHLTA